MTDMFAEYIVKRAPDAKSSAMRLLIIMASAILMYLALVLTQMFNLIVIMPASVALVAWVGYRCFILYSIEYEYTVTNGELDIDRIVARKGRKRMINIKSTQIRTISPYDDEHNAEYDEGKFAKTVDARSSPAADDVWYVIADQGEAGRVRVLFEPTPKMLNIFQTYLPRRMAVRYAPPVDDDEE
jgi:hypothetical protein